MSAVGIGIPEGPINFNLMEEYKSHGSAPSDDGINGLELEYRLLLGGDMTGNVQLTDPGKSQYKNFMWSRVLSMTHFSMAGCFANKLQDDLDEAKEEIQFSAAASNKEWRLLFNPRDHELSESARDIG